MRRRMRKYFWQRWHNRQGRLRPEKVENKAVPHETGQQLSWAWRFERSPMRQTVLNNARLRR
jgi:RNA-directed DNA polymerase